MIKIDWAGWAAPFLISQPLPRRSAPTVTVPCCGQLELLEEKVEKKITLFGWAALARLMTVAQDQLVTIVTQKLL